MEALAPDPVWCGEGWVNVSAKVVTDTRAFCHVADVEQSNLRPGFTPASCDSQRSGSTEKEVIRSTEHPRAADSCRCITRARENENKETDVSITLVVT